MSDIGLLEVVVRHRFRVAEKNGHVVREPRPRMTDEFDVKIDVQKVREVPPKQLPLIQERTPRR
ncbi:hypothetical protein [Gryllotalpicola koreensis]|uniref:hypothetical protein n=1 Tax=Gryllotalpicola koreensis TaxID=993086 RepID=UPI0031D9B28D